MMPVILMWSMPLAAAGGAPRDVEVVAFTEDGEMLYSTVCVDGFAARVGHGAPARARFQRRFPDGYSVTWIDSPWTDQRVAKALKLHAELGPDGDRRL